MRRKKLFLVSLNYITKKIVATMPQNTESSKESPFKHPFYFLINWRAFPFYELISYFMMFACVPLLFYGFQLYTWEIIKVIILAIATQYCGFFAALIWNDITDVDIDRIVHPSRPIPRGAITSGRFFMIALLFSALTFLFAFLISPWCFFIVGLAALFVAFHNRYLKKRIKFPAYSEIFTPMQWLVVPLIGAIVLWSALPLNGDVTFMVPLLGILSIHRSQVIPLLLLIAFTYFADDAHDLVEGIHDSEGDRRFGVRTYATSFGVGITARVAFIMVVIAGILGILLYTQTILSMLFIIPFVLLWLFTISRFYLLVHSQGEQQRQLGKKIGRVGFNFLIFSYVLIFIDVTLQILLLHFFGWVFP